jgi:hypothetical protein
VILVLFIAAAGLMAVVFVGFSVLVINTVGWLWPPEASPKAAWIAPERVVSEQAFVTAGAQRETNVEELSQQLKIMTETTLLRFGQVLK